MRPVLRLIGVLVAVLVVSACGGSEQTFDDAVLNVTIEAGQVEPNGERLELPVGVPIDVRITSDRPGEIHVHSKPASTISFVPGTTTGQVRIDTPGVVEVEEHLSGIVVAQLEMR